VKPCEGCFYINKFILKKEFRNVNIFFIDRAVRKQIVAEGDLVVTRFTDQGTFTIKIPLFSMNSINLYGVLSSYTLLKRVLTLTSRVATPF
jgi:hypothetical protein